MGIATSPSRELLVMRDDHGTQLGGVDRDVVVTRVWDPRRSHGPGLVSTLDQNAYKSGVDVLIEHEPHPVAKALTASRSAGVREGYAAKISASLRPASR